MDLDAAKSLIEMWGRELWARDPIAVTLGVGCLVGGSLLTSLGMRLGGRGAYSLARLGWQGAAWLLRPRPMGEMARLILLTMETVPAGLEGENVVYDHHLTITDRHIRWCGGEITSCFMPFERRQIFHRARQHHKQILDAAKKAQIEQLRNSLEKSLARRAEAESVDFDVCS